MKINSFFRLVVESSQSHLTVVCPESLGVNSSLRKVLNRISNHHDQIFVNAQGLTVSEAKDLINQTSFSPKGCSDRTHVFVFNTERISRLIVSILLKSVEESKCCRWIFQTSYLREDVLPVFSRTKVCHIPFLSRKVVLANLQKSGKDASSVDELNLYDGTIDGTIEGLVNSSKISTLKDLLRERSSYAVSDLLSDKVLFNLNF
jgi:hypothetical protein